MFHFDEFGRFFHSLDVFVVAWCPLACVGAGDVVVITDGDEASASNDSRMNNCFRFGKDFDIKPPKLKELPKNVLWVEQIGTDEREFMEDLVVDKDGSVYVAVVTKTRLRSRAFATSSFVRKYDSNGEILWNRPLDNFGSSSAAALSLDREVFPY